MPTRRVGLAVVAMVVACSSAASVATNTAAKAPTTTTAPVTTTVPSTRSPSENACPHAMVFDDEVWMLAADCSVSLTTLSRAEGWGDSGDLLIDDLAGGVLYQTDDKVIWHDEAHSDEAVPIAIAAEEEQVWLQDVSVLDGSAHVWFTRSRGRTIEDAVQTLERIPIGGAAVEVVDEIGGWESGSSVTVGGEVIASQTWSEGFYAFGIGDLQGERVDQPWNPYLEIEDPQVGCEDCPTGLVVSDDGARVAFLQPVGPEFTTYVIVVDLASGDELLRRMIDAKTCCNGVESQLKASGIDLLGDVVVVNQWAGYETRSFAIWIDMSDPGAAWQEMQVRGSVRLLRSELQAGLPER